MSKRKSERRSRRSSASRVLDQNTDVFENRDPLWAKRSAVRPSTSLHVVRSANSTLSSGSAARKSQLSSDEWYENLSHSDTSQILKMLSEKKASEAKGKQKYQVYTQTDTESEDEPRKKRAKLYRKRASDKRNVFAEALHTTASPAKVSSDKEQASRKDESESSKSEESLQTQKKKLRPRLFKAAKSKSFKDGTNKFDDASTSGRLVANRNLRSNTSLKDASKSPLSGQHRSETLDQSEGVNDNSVWKTLSSVALRDVQNTMPTLKKPRIILEKISLPGSESYVPLKKIIQRPGHSKSQVTHASECTESLAQSPSPAQSTLVVYGKPVKEMSAIFEDSASSKHSKLNSQPVDADQDVDVDVVNNSGEDGLHPAHHQFFSDELITSRKQLLEEQSKSKIDWTEVKRKTDAIKVKMEAVFEREMKEKFEQEKKKAVIDAKLQRFEARRAAELKKKQKKPIDKAYYVNGKVYKQPKLPKPGRWATKRLYKHLWTMMEPKFGLKTRITSEKFVMFMSEVYTIVLKTKKFEKYESNLDDLIHEMARLKIIKTRNDFYRFCSDYMPPQFNYKVVPMMLPGNERNIPFDPKLSFVPILSESSSDDECPENSRHRSKSDSESESE